MNFFLIGICGLILVLKNENPSQKSWKLILRTFILQASCAPRAACLLAAFHVHEIMISVQKVRKLTNNNLKVEKVK